MGWHLPLARTPKQMIFQNSCSDLHTYRVIKRIGYLVETSESH